jgi:hypothetical protein
MKIVHAADVLETTFSLIGLHYSVDQEEYDGQHFDDNDEKARHHVDEQEGDEMVDESIQ